MDSLTRLRDRPQLNALKTNSDTLYIRGISRNVENTDLHLLLSIVDAPLEVDFSTRGENVKHAGISGQVWAKYASPQLAKKTMLKLHNYYYYGVYLSVKYEFGLDPL